MKKQIGEIGNCYGGLIVKTKGDKYYWGIENYAGTSFDKIPKYLFDALLRYEEERKKPTPVNVFDKIKDSIEAEKQLLEKLENGETLELPKDLKPLVDSCCRRASKPLTGKVIYT